MYQPYTKEFQLHHTGIKTNNATREIRMQYYFNCTIQELKHVFKWVVIADGGISIAPYRN